MTTATLHRSTMSTAAPLSVGVALRELGVAGQRLAGALGAAVLARLHMEPSAQTASEAAQALRVYASTLATSDPRFARDLFAAADRHEFGDKA